MCLGEPYPMKSQASEDIHTSKSHDMIQDLCLFAHFNASGEIDAHVQRYVRAIHACGFELVFVSASPLHYRDVSELQAICRAVIVRPNGGLDFGSWAEAYSRYADQISGDLLLANDSVYGPIDDLKAAVKRLRALPGDLRGMVESLEIAPHLQSWFLLLSPKAHRSEAFRNIMALDFSAMSKAEIIEKGEVGLSVQCRSAGLASSALFSIAHRADDGDITRFNPSHMLWKELIEIYGVPFIKIELLRNNPYRLSNLSSWRAVVDARSPDWTSLIERHLATLQIFPVPTPFYYLPCLRDEYFLRRDHRLDKAGKAVMQLLNKQAFRLVRTAKSRIRNLLRGSMPRI